MKSVLSVLVLLLITEFCLASAAAEQAPAQVLFNKVQIFNGVDNKLITGQQVLVEGGRIKAVGTLAVNSNAILVDVSPLEDMSVLGASFDMWAAPRTTREIKTIPFVMKDGKIFYNQLN